MYPTKEQEVMLLKTAGTARYAYNWALDRWKSMYSAWMEDRSKQKPSTFGLINLWTKFKPEWSAETAHCAQQHAIMNLGKAFQNLWRGTGRYPTFHKKGRKDSFYIGNDKGALKKAGNHWLFRCPNIGWISLAEAPRFEGKIMSYTVSHYADQWHVAIQYDLLEVEDTKCLNPTSVVGIDVGLKHIAVASDGTVCDAPESLKRLDAKLKKAQQVLSRKQKGSNNSAKALLKKQRIQNKINNIRKDVTHKFTTAITKNHGIVVTEDLHIQDMVAKANYRSLRRSFAASMMGMILFQLSYKAQKHHKVDRFFPSTKRCSSCGHVKDHIDLGERMYRCGHCGAVIDRDLNAALNLKNAGPVRPVAPVDSAVDR
jgi:putative transposase